MSETLIDLLRSSTPFHSEARETVAREITRLRADLAALEKKHQTWVDGAGVIIAARTADLAAAQEERDNLTKEVSHLRTAMSREDGPQYLASLLMEAEVALLSVAQQRGEAERERDAAQEREQRMREALRALVDRDARYDGAAIIIETAAHWQALKLMADARAALGEP